MGGLGRGDHRQYPGFGFGNHHPAADRRHCRVVDGERCGADDDLLRAEDPAPLVLPGRLVCHLCGRVADDRQFVDDDRHDRRGADGHPGRPWVSPRGGSRGRSSPALTSATRSRSCPILRCSRRRPSGFRFSRTYVTCCIRPSRRSSSRWRFSSSRG